MARCVLVGIDRRARIELAIALCHHRRAPGERRRCHEHAHRSSSGCGFGASPPRRSPTVVNVCLAAPRPGATSRRHRRVLLARDAFPHLTTHPRPAAAFVSVSIESYEPKGAAKRGPPGWSPVMNRRWPVLVMPDPYADVSSEESRILSDAVIEMPIALLHSTIPTRIYFRTRHRR